MNGSGCLLTANIAINAYWTPWQQIASSRVKAWRSWPPDLMTALRSPICACTPSTDRDRSNQEGLSAGYCLFDGSERRARLRAVGAAGLRHVGPPAPALAS